MLQLLKQHFTGLAEHEFKDTIRNRKQEMDFLASSVTRMFQISFQVPSFFYSKCTMCDWLFIMRTNQCVMRYGVSIPLVRAC